MPGKNRIGHKGSKLKQQSYAHCPGSKFKGAILARISALMQRHCVDTEGGVLAREHGAAPLRQDASAEHSQHRPRTVSAGNSLHHFGAWFGGREGGGRGLTAEFCALR